MEEGTIHRRMQQSERKKLMSWRIPRYQNKKPKKKGPKQRTKEILE